MQGHSSIVSDAGNCGYRTFRSRRVSSDTFGIGLDRLILRGCWRRLLRGRCLGGF